jgi:hypothetical protein
MKSKKLLMLVFSLILSCLIFGTSSFAIAAPQDNPSENGPPIKVIVIVHYPHHPDRVFSGIEGGVLVEQVGYVYNGVHWENPSINYYINLSKQNPDFEAGIIGAFNAWNNVSTAFQATCGGLTKSQPLTRQARWNRKTQSYTGAVNVVGWKDISRLYPDAIGVTYIWGYDVGTESHIFEVDTALNSNSFFHWWQTVVVDDPNNNTWPSSQISNAYDVDVQNIMTHEAGHWLVLGDIYVTTPSYDPETDPYLTMWGTAPQNELQKRSLEAGDVAGIQAIY